MAQRYFTFNGHAIGGNGGAGMVIMDLPELPTPAANTLRFDFGDKTYDPTVAGVGSSGTWTKLSHPLNNIWDWTNNNTSWANAFKKAFLDPTNPVSIIDAGDTSTITSIANIFQGDYTSDFSMPDYQLIARNNIVYCVPFNVSSCTAFHRAFAATCIKHPIQFTFPTNMTLTLYALFGDTLIEDIDVFDCCGASNSVALAIFVRCNKLLHVGRVIGVENIINASGMFSFCNYLEEIEYIAPLEHATSIQAILQHVGQNSPTTTILPKITAPNVNDISAAFNSCHKAAHIEVEFGTNITNAYAAFICHNIDSLPLIDLHNCTNIQQIAMYANAISDIPNYDVSSVTNCNQAFSNCTHVKTGILEMYNKLLARGNNITDHTDCFLNCGSETEEGRAALAQIPVSWGGTMVEPGE